MSGASTIAEIRRERDALAEEVEQLKQKLRQNVEPVAHSEAFKLGLSRTEAAIFYRMDQNNSVSFETLQCIIENINDCVCSVERVRVSIHQIGKKLKNKGYRIRNIYGVGYRLERLS